MSRHSAGACFDNSLDSSHDHRYASHDASDVAQTVAASSVIAPWSEYNTRVPPEHLSPCGPSNFHAQLSPASDSATLDYATKAFSGDSLLRYTSPDAPLISNYSTYPRRSNLVTAPIVPASFSSLSSQGFNHNKEGVVTCGECGQVFTGTFRARNLSRHINQKHANQNQYACMAEGCTKIYQRQDARIKHARKKHPELQLSPVQRRNGTDHCSSKAYTCEDIHVAQDLNYYVGQWSKGGQISSSSCTAKMQYDVNPSTGVDVVRDLKANLTPSQRSHIWSTFFTRWECIIQQLWNDQSVAYCIYAKVIEDVRATVHAVGDTAYSSRAAEPSGYSNRVPQCEQNGSCASADSALVHSTGITSPPNRIWKRGERRLSITGASGKNVLVATDDIAEIKEHREVDCPVYKHHLMYGTVPPCRGCRERLMSQVRSHLNRAAGSHGGFPRFVQQCRRCKQDFVERQTYDSHKSANTCAHQRQVRRDIVISWARQYLAIYPEARQIPLPWCDEMGWLPVSVLNHCRGSCVNSIAHESFLERGQGQADSHLQTQDPAENSSTDPVYNNIVGFVMYDLVNPTFTQATGSSTPVQNHARQDTVSLQEMTTEVSSRNDNYWNRVLRGFIHQQRTMLDAAAHLTEVQLRMQAEQCEQMYALSRTFYQQRQPQLTHVQVHPPITDDSFQIENLDSPSDLPLQPHYATPMRPQYDQYTIPDPNTQFVTLNPSTLPSTRSYGTWSSRHQAITDPSSTYNTSLLSPCSTSPHRRSSLPTGIEQDALRFRALPSRISLPTAPDDCIDPSLLDSPSEDNDEDYYGILQDFSARRS